MNFKKMTIKQILLSSQVAILTFGEYCIFRCIKLVILLALVFLCRVTVP